MSVYKSLATTALEQPLTEAQLRGAPLDTNLAPNAATASNQQTEITSLQSIDSKMNVQSTAALQTTGNSTLSSIDNRLLLQATAANQATSNSSLASIDSKLTSQATSALQTSGNSSLSSIDTKVSTSALQSTANTSLASIDSKLTTVSTSALQSTGNASLSSIDTKLNTQSTASLQATGNASLASIDSKLTAPLSTTTVLAAESTKVIGTVNIASGGILASVASAAAAAITAIIIAANTIVSSANTSAFSTANVQSASFQVNVTAATGSNPTLDLTLQESYDGSTWFRVYDFERVTAATVIRTPIIQLSGAFYRFVQTVGGTSPSFTLSYTANTRAVPALIYRRLVDRNLTNTANAVTSALEVAGCSKINLTVVLNGTSVVSPSIRLQGSDDLSNWYTLSTINLTLLAAGGTSQAAAAEILPKYVRAIVATAGTISGTITVTTITASS